jgi:hypothetical protein
MQHYMRRKAPHIAALISVICALSACTYEGIRMSERRKCAAMPQTQAERCYSRTRMTKAEYETARRKVKAANESDDGKKKPVDPRYEQWIP